MKKMFILIGNSGTGKTTLAQALYGEDLLYQKTQTIEIRSNIIDTPGEYLEHKNMSHNLLVSSYDADLVVLCDAANNEEMFLPPGYSSMFNIPVVGVITKIDLNTNIETAEFRLRYAGAQRIFPVSSVTGEGIGELANYLREFGYDGDAGIL